MTPSTLIREANGTCGTIAVLAIAVLTSTVIPKLEWRTRCTGSPSVRQLVRLEKNARAYAAQHGAFPIGRAMRLPASACCPHRCDSVAAHVWALDPVWSVLRFTIREPFQGRISYESMEGRTFVARVVTDLDCDGNEATWVLTASVEGSTLLTAPPRGVY